ncbi:MAG: hypothetical protein QNK70_09250 [Crocinitomicaceae bacterium]
MIENSIWGNTTSLLVTYNFEKEPSLKEFRKALDQVLNTSIVERVIIIVSIQKGVDKSSLSPHFLIYYNGPSDYSLFGGLKDHQLANELERSFDVLLCFGVMQKNIKSAIKQTNIQRKILVNSELTEDKTYDLELNSASDSPYEVIHFVVETLQKINAHEPQL